MGSAILFLTIFVGVISFFFISDSIRHNKRNKNWSVIEAPNSDAHVIPNNDHILHHINDRCICGPLIEPVKRKDGSVGWMYTHNAADHRELYEEP